jgi:hypothetical protein
MVLMMMLYETAIDTYMDILKGPLLPAKCNILFGITIAETALGKEVRGYQ